MNNRCRLMGSIYSSLENRPLITPLLTGSLDYLQSHPAVPAQNLPTSHVPSNRHSNRHSSCMLLVQAPEADRQRT